MLSKDDVIDYLSGLSPMELQDLVTELGGVWEVARPPVDVWYIPVEIAPDPDLVLVEVGPRRVLVMKALREEFGFDLQEVRALVDAAPSLLLREADPRITERVIRELGLLGATAEGRVRDNIWD